MEGRLSVAQAREIKKKRELAQELRMYHFVKQLYLIHVLIIPAEDVQAFHKAFSGRSSKAREIAEVESNNAESDKEESDVDLTAQPKRKVRCYHRHAKTVSDLLL